MHSATEADAGRTTLEGVDDDDETIRSARPGVLVGHQRMGPTDDETQRAGRPAQLGDPVSCADIDGKGDRSRIREKAAALAGTFNPIFK